MEYRINKTIFREGLNYRVYGYIVGYENKGKPYTHFLLPSSFRNDYDTFKEYCISHYYYINKK